VDSRGAAGPEPDFRPLDPRNIQLDRIVSLIFAGVVFIGTMVGMLIWAVARWEIDILWIAIAIGAFAICAMLSVLAIVWPPIEYRHTQYRLSDQGLEIHRGVYWRHRISVPIARLQHADVSQGPFQRYFELGKLTVHTAGTQNASVELNGLTFETAVLLRDQLLAERKAIDVL
jgi:hypothetical protein